MKLTDTITAIASAVSNSGIGIIRLSGDEAIEIADKIFIGKSGKKLKESKTHTIHYGNIIHNGQVIDEVLVLLMKAPNTYTREDVVEIDCHGGVLVMNRVLEVCNKNGARLAEPGEFTKRAFLNGRIDLSQAEAVIDVINAKNDYALDSSVSQLSGKVSEKIKEIRATLLHHIAFIEAALDDPEHISIDGYNVELKKVILDVLGELNKLIESADDGRIISEGIKTVILGKPNVGKSSLLNRLSGSDRAIVTDIAGTTRDILQENIRVKGLGLNIIDTAGIRETKDTVEKIGVQKAIEVSKTADLIIFVVDSSKELDENDRQILEIIKDRKAIVLLNKTDLDIKVSEEKIKKYTDKRIISISALKDEGIEQISECIHEMFGKGEIDFNDQVYITNVRHKAAIEEAYESVGRVLESIENGMPEDFYSIDIMDAYEVLGTVIGESLEEDLVDEIFSKFCMGK